MRDRAWRLFVRPALCLFPIILVAAGPKKNPPAQNYESWNDKWFASCQGESFIVNVKVGSPKKAGPHSFDAYFLEGGGICSIGKDAPIKRFQFLHGTMSNGKISGTIFLCTRSQELVDANTLNAVFTRDFVATYDPQNANITDANYKGEHYKRYESDTQDGSSSRRSGEDTKKPYQRDEPGDAEAAFEMHLYRGPAYDQVSQSDTNPPRSPTPSPASQAQQKLNDVVHDGMHDWMNEFRKLLGADPI